MTNLTVAVDDGVVARARRKAAEQGTSLSALVGEFLEDYAGRQDAAAALRELFEIADRAGGSVGEGGITWTRDELHDRANLR